MILRKSLVRVAVIIAWLIAIDCGFLAVRYLRPGSSLASTAANQQSLEARIRSLFDSAGVPIGGPDSLAYAGWADPSRRNYRWRGDRPDDGRRVTIYGMSFSSDVGRALREIAPELSVRLIDAPSSTASHSLALAEVDPEPGQVAVLGILSSQVVKEGSMIGALISTGNLAPYTSPAMVELKDGSWDRIRPAINSLEEFGQSIASRDGRWSEFLSQMRGSDPLYSSFVFEQSWLDHSFVMGLVRRAWDRSVEDRAGRRRLELRDDGSSSASRFLGEIVRRFAALSRGRGECPVVMVIRTFRDSNDICAMVEEAGHRLGVPVYCVEAVVDFRDSGNFKPDMHYTDEACMMMAEGLRDFLTKACPRDSDSP